MTLNDQSEAAKLGLASLMWPDNAASDHVRCGRSRYATAPTQAAAIIAALRARWHFTSDFCAGCPTLRRAKSSLRCGSLSSICRNISSRRAEVDVTAGRADRTAYRRRNDCFHYVHSPLPPTIPTHRSARRWRAGRAGIRDRSRRPRSALGADTAKIERAPAERAARRVTCADTRPTRPCLRHHLREWLPPGLAA